MVVQQWGGILIAFLKDCIGTRLDRWRAIGANDITGEEPRGNGEREQGIEREEVRNATRRCVGSVTPLGARRCFDTWRAPCTGASAKAEPSPFSNAYVGQAVGVSAVPYGTEGGRFVLVEDN